MDIFETVLQKIATQTVTKEDFNLLIAESMPESVRKRVQRKMRPDNTKHVNKKTGHNRLNPIPNLADRVQPKRKPGHQQNHGQAKAAHDRSTETQRKNADK